MNRCDRIIVALANLVWLLSCLPSLILFWIESGNVRRAQEKVLHSILNRNRLSDFGIKYNFSGMQSVEMFIKVPVSEYEDYHSAFVNIRDGQQGLLTTDPVQLLQPTSGSSAATKLIPYTKTLRKQFMAAICPWIGSMYLSCPSLLLGRQYWSISPSTRVDSNSVVRVGFQDDAEYLGFFAKRISKLLFVVPPEISQVSDSRAFGYLTLLFLVRERNLRLISVWHASFLTILINNLAVNMGSIVDDLRRRKIQDSLNLSPDLRRLFESYLVPMPKRAEQLLGIDLSKVDYPSKIWPDLKVISCWTEGFSQAWIDILKGVFPNVLIIGKGLVATEGIVSFPMGQAGKTAAIRSHFFEFEDVEDGRILFLWELKAGKKYGVVITTGGGLYRYRLHDVVKVTRFFRKTPCFEFIFRDNLVSDIIGEKLNGQHVEAAILRCSEECRIKFSFAILAPCLSSENLGYVFYFHDSNDADSEYSILASTLEEKLCANYHYLHARLLGQLDAVRVFRIRCNADATYNMFIAEKGVKAGAVKFPALCLRGGLDKVFDGEYIA